MAEKDDKVCELKVKGTAPPQDMNENGKLKWNLYY